MTAFRELVSSNSWPSAVLAIHSVALVVLLSAACPAQQSEGPRFALQVPDSLPEPSEPATTEAQIAGDCEQVPPDPPLSALSADISPRKDGQIVSSDQLPTDCAKFALGSAPAQMLLPSGRCEPSACELLQLARFCHRPLYFNDECLERYGVRSCCCQPAASAARFYGGALLMPIRMLQQCPCDCVSTPACY
jgi:hypothetical protein